MRPFLAYVRLCKENYHNIVQQLPSSWNFTDKHSSTLFDFLFNDVRNEKVYEEYLYKIK